MAKLQQRQAASASVQQASTRAKSNLKCSARRVKVGRRQYTQRMEAWFSRRVRALQTFGPQLNFLTDKPTIHGASIAPAAATKGV